MRGCFRLAGTHVHHHSLRCQAGPLHHQPLHPQHPPQQLPHARPTHRPLPPAHHCRPPPPTSRRGLSARGLPPSGSGAFSLGAVFMEGREDGGGVSIRGLSSPRSETHAWSLPAAGERLEPWPGLPGGTHGSCRRAENFCSVCKTLPQVERNHLSFWFFLLVASADE